MVRCQKTVAFLLQWLSLLFLSGMAVESSVTGTPSIARHAEVDLGTTLVAIKYKDGVVVAADSRTSVSGYVSHRYADKIVPVFSSSRSSCVLCRSGSAADTQWLANQARCEFQDRMARYGGLCPSLSQIAHYLKGQAYQSDSELSISLIVAGYDAMEQSAKLYTISASGALLEEVQYASAGSGSTFVLGYLDHHVRSQVTALEEDQAIDLCQRAIELAIQRDGSSGGIVRLFICNATGGVRELTPRVPNVNPTALPPPATTTKTTTSPLAGFQDAQLP